VLFAEQSPTGLGALSLPVPSSLDLAALALATVAATLLLGVRLGLVRTLALTAGGGLLLDVAGLA
jgi:chromate transporter